jgi:hypothetical protein
MKDVIKERNQEIRTQAPEETGTSAQRAMFVIKQGIYLVRTEPLIFFGIWGSVLQMNLKMISMGTSNLAI